ncbi:LysR family transcriptional regulator [Pseudodonghicola sp.]|uniref:LysR family transcriptional regulator n=1 Tax=Pseudodonghicola sp. TaxID=1969463 RepID=UPI003A977812
MLDDLSLFVHIVQANGLAAAAQRLNLPPATVSRRLRRLEETLGLHLIHRSARRFALTPQGEVYYRELADQVGRIEASLRGLSHDLHSLSGRLTVTAPTNLSVRLLRPMWREFQQAHPEIALDLRLSNLMTDLVATGADLALRIGPQPDSGFFQKRLGLARSVLVCAPGYLAAHGSPESPRDLQAHRIVGFVPLPEWRLSHVETGETQVVQLSIAAAVDDIALQREWVCDGLGIALLPVSEVSEEIGNGQLCRVLPEWRGPDREIFAIWPSGRLLSARARALRDFMARHIGALPYLQGELPPAPGTD